MGFDALPADSRSRRGRGGARRAVWALCPAPPSLGGRPAIDRHVRQSYGEEYLAGVDRAIAAGVWLRVQYIRRNFRRTVGFIDTGTTWTPTTVIDPGPDGLVGNGGDERPILLYYDYHPEQASLVLTNPPTAWRHYDGFQIIATRRANGRWSGLLHMGAGARQLR